MNLYLIGDIPGFTPQIGGVVSMMNYARSTTLQAVAGLGVDYYLGRLEQVRAKTIAELGRRNDQWLDEHTVSGSGQRVNRFTAPAI